MKNWGGQFTPELGGHFELESGAHFKLELGGQYHRNMQLVQLFVCKRFSDNAGQNFLPTHILPQQSSVYTPIFG